MKNFSTVYLLFLIPAVFALAGCDNLTGLNGNGNVKSEERSVGSFDQISAGGAFEIFLTQGDSESLRVEADENLLSLIETTVRSGRLVIRSRENIGRSKKLNVYITFRELTKIEASGACDISGTGQLNFNNLVLNGSGASEIDLSLRAGKLRGDYSGASEVEFEGSAEMCEFKLSGACELEAPNLIVGQMTIKLSGASKAEVQVIEQLEVNASGASSVVYTGDPVVEQHTSGASKVRKK
ncbi:MAG TPA: head GIN domain-containing protein [Bacteroidales bacterium]|nr:head GIN domain-containing protein [Bacteroidales bacterium]